MQEIIYFLSNHSILSLMWLALFATFIITTLQNWFSSIGKLSREEAIRLINKEDAVIIDLRNRDEFRMGNIVNSVNLPAINIKNGHFGKLDKTKNNPVIIVCNTGSNSHEPAKNLKKAGFKRVYILKEGIFGWNEENLPLVRSK